MNKILNTLMLSCHKATELIEKKTVFSLSPAEKVQLYLHTRVCDACRNYQKQSELLDVVLEQELKALHEENISEDRNTDDQRIIRLKGKLDTEKFS